MPQIILSAKDGKIVATSTGTYASMEVITAPSELPPSPRVQISEPPPIKLPPAGKL